MAKHNKFSFEFKGETYTRTSAREYTHAAVVEHKGEVWGVSFHGSHKGAERAERPMVAKLNSAGAKVFRKGRQVFEKGGTVTVVAL